MGNEPSIVAYAREFIQTYLRTIRHKSSVFSSRDWGFFPRYWFCPIKINIFSTITGEVAISFGDIAKSREDRIRTIQYESRIEENQFPNLDYGKWPFFFVPNGTHHSMIKGGTLSVGDHPVIVFGQGVEFKLMDIRVEADVLGYPRQREFIWFFTDPSRQWLVNYERAAQDAENDFWDRISSIVFTKLDSILTRDFTTNVAGIFLDSVNRLQVEYHSLITQQDIEEQRLQNFLENHFFLIDPKKSFTKEKRKLGEYYADFVLKYAEGDLTLVEIQLNSDSIVENGKPSYGLKEAVDQLQSWFEWIRVNQKSALSFYSGLIIIGRRQSYEGNQKEIERILSCLTRPVKLLTYDDLENSFDYVRGQLLGKARASPN